MPTPSVAPLRIARGIQNKVLEAMAMGRPVVASPQAFEGVRAAAGHATCWWPTVRRRRLTRSRTCCWTASLDRPGLPARAVERGYSLGSDRCTALDALLARSGRGRRAVARGRWRDERPDRCLPARLARLDAARGRRCRCSAVGLLLLGLLFQDEVAAAVRVWFDLDRLQPLLPGDPDRALSRLGPA